jgi:hypothetical protein
MFGRRQVSISHQVIISIQQGMLNGNRYGDEK